MRFAKGEAKAPLHHPAAVSDTYGRTTLIVCGLLRENLLILFVVPLRGLDCTAIHQERIEPVEPYYQDADTTLYLGDCREVLPVLAPNSISSVVCDPPYELGFMGKSWDRKGNAYDVAVWSECIRVLKPGGHLLAFGGSRTYHRLACAIEDAGFEIRDQIQWIYGSGFPKSLDVSKAIDSAAGAERETLGPSARHGGGSLNGFNKGTGETLGNSVVPLITLPATEAAHQWSGWGTALKPAHEPIVVARKPLEGTVVDNVLKWGTGGINVDGCRIETRETLSAGSRRLGDGIKYGFCQPSTEYEQNANGRWPSNVIHDGSDGVLAAFPDAPGQQGDLRGHSKDRLSKGIFGDMKAARDAVARLDSGSAARFFYCAKADQEDRNEGCEHLEPKIADTSHQRPRAELNDPRRAGVTPRKNHHPTVKPNSLMRYLCRLVTPPGGLVLDPFCGSGSTGKAAILEGLRFVGVELEPEYVELAKLRIRAATKQGLFRFA